MPFIAIAKIDQLSAGQPHPIHAAGKDLVLCQVGGELYVVEGVCPHLGGPLGHGTLDGRMLICPWHAWEFDCTTGEHDRNPALRVATYPVAVSEGEVLVDLPDA